MATLKRFIAMALVLVMCISALPMQAFAAETTTETETKTEGGMTTTTTTTTTTDTDENGTTSVVVKIEKESVGQTEDGKDIRVETEVETKEEVKENGDSYEFEETKTHTTTSSTENGVFTYTEKETVIGSEKTTETSTTVDATVDIPVTDEEGQNKNTVTTGDEVGTRNENGDETETVVQQGSVTVTTENIETNRVVDAEGTDLEYVKSETNPDGTNDLTHVGAAPEQYLPGYEGEVKAPEGSAEDGYQFVYVGSGNTSMLVPAIVFDKPMSPEDKVAMYGENAYIGSSYRSYYISCLPEEEKARIAKDENGNYKTDENGFLLDVDGNRVLKGELTAVDPEGNTVWLHRFDATGNGHKVEGWYENGEWVEDLNGDKKFTAIWAGPQQFVMVDDQGNIVTTYCADFATPTQDAYGYFMQNLEDATYYSDKEAEQIRAIAMNGYWGTEEGFGSLEAIVANLKEAGFSEEELKSLSDGVALTATQMAIWSCSNKMSGIEFINAHYSNWGTGNVPEDKEDEVKLLFKYYDYLMGLDAVETKGTTADTIIGADFLKDLSINVIEKAEHENNNDADDTNDAYVTSLTFALVVKPSTENGDDLIVKVVDAHGKTLAEARIAGQAKEGEQMQTLTPDGEGNYTLSGITMIEGDHTFNISLEGIQNLDHGVYLYTSEVTEGVSSQTMVGVAEGEQGVNVSMNLTFNLSVDDEIIVTEREWEYEGDPMTITVFPEEPEEEDPNVPELVIEDEVIPEEPVPLADAPKTGDETGLWMGLIVLISVGMCVINITGKKNRYESF